MIKVKKLKELLANIPDDDDVWAYEGEDSGIAIGKIGLIHGFKWIRCRCDKTEDTYTEGFK